jgi:hypothetical protein
MAMTPRRVGFWQSAYESGPLGYRHPELLVDRTWSAVGASAARRIPPPRCVC